MRRNICRILIRIILCRKKKISRLRVLIVMLKCICWFKMVNMFAINVVLPRVG